MPSVRLRIFWPLLCWLIASSIFFLWQYHRTRASRAALEFSVSMEGLAGQISYQVTVNGLPYQAGQACGLGWKKLVVEADGAEPFQTNCFVFYGGKEFGKITLARSRGRMDLDFSPAVETVRIIGSEDTKTFDNLAHESLLLPTGRYTVQAKFARFSMERTVEVTRNQATRVSMAPSITTLQLSSDPADAQFELSSTKPPEVSVKGSTPATVAGVPTGEYTLAISRGDYRKNLSVSMAGTRATNDVKVEFRYAKLSITSDPTDAAISDGGKVVGKTPASLDLQPGSYRFQIVKDGYFATNVSLVLSETDSRNVAVSLANVSFVEAMERGRSEAASFSPDYDRALADVEKALQIKPGDETALQLKRTIEFKRHLQNAKQFQRNRDFTKALAEADAALELGSNDAGALALKGELENGRRVAAEQQAKSEQAAAAARARTEQTAAAVRAEARRNHPQKALEEITSRIRYHELFQTQVIRLNGSLDNVRAGVVRALGRKPEWKVGRDEKSDPDTARIAAATKGFGWKQNVELVAGQVADNEVVICFKLFAFVLGENVQLTLGGFPDESYKPLHPKHVQPARASAVERTLAHDTQEFKKRLEDELR